MGSGRAEGGSPQRSSSNEGRQRRRWLGPEVVDGEGVDLVELQTRAVFLEVVVRLEMLGWRWSMVTCAEEEGGRVNLLIRH
jgi:hypothetical protein